MFFEQNKFHNIEWNDVELWSVKELKVLSYRSPGENENNLETPCQCSKRVSTDASLLHLSYHICLEIV
jgi:hypothetical protein